MYFYPNKQGQNALIDVSFFFLKYQIKYYRGKTFKVSIELRKE